MSSTILYKFRSGTTFEALPLPGSAARLFDVKKAIVTAKKLDAGTMDFDLSVRNAATNEEYTDESMLLPRGTRLVVQRLPAAKGQGFLARMARNQYGMPPSAPSAPGSGGAPSGFYEIDSRARDDDEEFVSSEDQELALLNAARDTASANPAPGGLRPATTGNFGRTAGQGPPQHHHQHQGGQQRQMKQRQNADPEIREQEKKLVGRKRATGIPRTFLNLSAPPTTEAKEGEGEENNAPLLQPNTLGFEELKQRAGAWL
ncbi:Retinoblastoma binding protein 6 [Seminavis robusta]|uniref:Retinoblastoma binding protein 6 n=1 Tax=Seminavis robusta TaxID=568900 RepID=A0A9N8EHD0_9STRA|nr:Retinoblastoma binding protein 6 [Seminavis robusta]|eukprot:Sro1007_g230390.1 Retinoblastoma binding protein 6 (259) ;mRNA; f:14954-15833